jgi:hypothetical protein
MKTTTNPNPKKSPASKAREVGKARRAVPVAERSVRRRNKTTRDTRATTSIPPAKSGKARAGTSQRDVPTNRQQFRAWRASLPTAFERDTLLTPEWVAENVVQEVERFLKADLPDNFAERLAAKAHYLYPRHKHFNKGMNRPGNRGRENLLMFMRHWTAGWLRRERYALFKKLPWSFGNGKRLPM